MSDHDFDSDTSPTLEPLRRAVEEWAQLKKTPDWAFAAAKASARWGQGRELSETEFDEAVHAACNVTLG